jgi:hypothetical protein
MPLEQLVNEHMKEAMKSGDRLRLDTLRMLRASIIEFNKSGNAQNGMTEEDEQKILLNAAKKRKDAIEMYKQANRSDLQEKEELELHIIQSYLPEQLSEEEIHAAINTLITQTGAQGPKDMGKVMGLAMKELRGKADGTKVQSILKSILNPA